MNNENCAQPDMQLCLHQSDEYTLYHHTILFSVYDCTMEQFLLRLSCSGWGMWSESIKSGQVTRKSLKASYKVQGKCQGPH